jgi:putative ABC transport system ATP-binding protein
MISLRSVSKSFTRRTGGVQALVEATLDVPAGDFISIVGPSGSGKSTLLYVAGGMLSPTSGQVMVESRSLYGLGIEDRAWLRRNTFGFVFQTFNLIPYLSALENVQVPLLLSGLSSGDQERKARGLLERFGLSDRLEHKPFELSVGQQQRVALARMMANDPKIILADEPTANLDPENAGMVVKFLQDMNREGKTILMVTHSPELSRIAKRVLKLEQGRIAGG